MAARFIDEGTWVRKEASSDGPAGATGTRKDMPKSQAPGA